MYFTSKQKIARAKKIFSELQMANAVAFSVKDIIVKITNSLNERGITRF
jgi:hypothetical protein